MTFDEAYQHLKNQQVQLVAAIPPRADNKIKVKQKIEVTEADDFSAKLALCHKLKQTDLDLSVEAFKLYSQQHRLYKVYALVVFEK